MSGLAAAIRLSMFQKKVCVLEKHTVPGGLNSYYKRGRRDFDVGLHALTNFSAKGDRKKPLNRLLRQLRLNYEDFQLEEQVQSKILFPEAELTFTNDFQVLLEDVAKTFPHQVQGFIKLVEFIESYNELDLQLPTFQSAKEKMAQFISDSTLLEMILCPLLIYGSAWEQDMDFGQFVVMFKSIYLQGFSRPKGGVRRILSLLLERLQEEGGELRYGSEVKRLHTHNQKIKGVELSTGEFLTTTCLISSMGYPETFALCTEADEIALELRPRVGRLSFVESILVLEKTAAHFHFDSTITFYNNSSQYEYRKPEGLVDPMSAVVCCPDNFSPRNFEGEGVLRVTMLANFDKWRDLPRPVYREEKERVFELSLEILKKCLPGFAEKVVFKDVFTPKTILRYTGHFGGVVYGSPDKTRDGRTPFQGIYICGTDQGFLGIVGAMLSGITISNLYGLMGEAGEPRMELGKELR